MLVKCSVCDTERNLKELSECQFCHRPCCSRSVEKCATGYKIKGFTEKNPSNFKEVIAAFCVNCHNPKSETPPPSESCDLDNETSGA